MLPDNYNVHVIENYRNENDYTLHITENGIPRCNGSYDTTGWYSTSKKLSQVVQEIITSHVCKPCIKIIFQDMPKQNLLYLLTNSHIKIRNYVGTELHDRQAFNLTGYVYQKAISIRPELERERRKIITKLSSLQEEFEKLTADLSETNNKIRETDRLVNILSKLRS